MMINDNTLLSDQVWNVLAHRSSSFCNVTDETEKEPKIHTFTTTKQSQKTIFKALQYAFVLGLSCCTKECFSLTSLRSGTLYLRLIYIHCSGYGWGFIWSATGLCSGSSTFQCLHVATRGHYIHLYLLYRLLLHFKTFKTINN